MADIKRLKLAGICTIKGIQMTTRKKLGNIRGFSEAKVDKIKEACSKLSPDGFVTGTQVCIQRQAIFQISTGSQELE